MDLNVYDIIKGPRASTKAQMINKKEKKIVLEVHTKATKSHIKLAVQQLFQVKVEKVRTLITKKRKSKGTSRRRRVAVPAMRKTKIAYVSLAEGYELNLFEQAEMATAQNRE